MSDDYLAAQRRAFEAQFGSLEEMGFEDKTKTAAHSDEQSSGDESDTQSLESDESMSEGEGDDDEDEDFRGFSDDDDKPQPKVIKFADTTREYTGPSKEEKKLLKSGKAPSLKPKITQDNKKKGPKTKEDDDDLKNDLELQRFLDESHILANFQEQNSGADLTLKTINSSDGVIGNARKHTINNRLKQLSSVNAVKQQSLEKMPISMRRGMVKSRMEKIARYEKEAKEEGIILSKVKKGEFRNIGGSLTISDRIGTGIKAQLDEKRKYRQKGLRIQSVGRSTRNGLVISQREIERINGPPGGFKKGKKGRR